MSPGELGTVGDERACGEQKQCKGARWRPGGFERFLGSAHQFWASHEGHAFGAGQVHCAKGRGAGEHTRRPLELIEQRMKRMQVVKNGCARSVTERRRALGRVAGIGWLAAVHCEPKTAIQKP